MYLKSLFNVNLNCSQFKIVSLGRMEWNKKLYLKDNSGEGEPVSQSCHPANGKIDN